MNDRDELVRRFAMLRRRELIDKAVMMRTPVDRPVFCATNDVESWLVSCMAGSRQVVAAVCGRLVPEDWTCDRYRELFVLFAAISSGDTKAEEPLSEMLKKLSVKSIGTTPAEVVLACGRLRRARRQRLIFKLSEKLFVDGDDQNWLDQAKRAIEQVEAIHDVTPLKDVK